MYNIRCESILGTSHSWAITMRSILEEFKKSGHKLYIKSTNGRELINNILIEDIDKWHNSPDLDIAYTIPNNFKTRFQKTSKVKASIFNYETSIVPSEWLNEVKFVDFIFPSSSWSKDVLVNNGWDEAKCKVIPLGINPSMKLSKERLKLNNNNKKFKFLNISIPHHRKNIDLLIEAYYSAFKKEDDVSLIIKTSLAKPKAEFECNFIEILKEAQKKFGSNVPQIEVITDQIDDMSKLYNSCDSIVSASSSEGFGLPLLEGLLFEKIVIAPNCTGQLDFLNKDNSILVDIKEVPAGKKYQYWRPSSGAKTYMPSVDSIAESMLKAYKGNVSFKENLHSISDFVATNYTWKHSSDRILELLK